jgi:ribosomal 50S subunit-associated protein YjgA (DUF615 family)
MKDEFDQLLKLVIKAGEDVRPDFSGVLTKMVHFFQLMRDEFVSASASERKEIVEQLKKMHEKLSHEFQKTLKKLGINEDQLVNYMEESKFFSDWQQEMLAKAKRSIDETKKSVSRKTKSTKSTEKEKTPSSRKSKWMKT